MVASDNIVDSVNCDEWVQLDQMKAGCKNNQHTLPTFYILISISLDILKLSYTQLHVDSIFSRV